MLLLASLPAAALAAGGIESFFASNCEVNTCKKNPGEKAEEELKHAEEEGFTQAGGHPNFGITDFRINTVGTGKNQAPTGARDPHQDRRRAGRRAPTLRLAEVLASAQYGTQLTGNGVLLRRRRAPRKARSA